MARESYLTWLREQEMRTRSGQHDVEVHEKDYKFMVGPDIPGQLFKACWLTSAGNTHNLSGIPLALYTMYMYLLHVRSCIKYYLLHIHTCMMDRRACTKHMTYVHVSACAYKHDRHNFNTCTCTCIYKHYILARNAAELDAWSGVLGNRLFTPAALCAPDG